VRIYDFIVILLFMAGLIGCSADPYRGPIPAPPDWLHAVVPSPPATLGPEAMNWVTISVPLSDPSDDALAPNYSGYIPPLGNN
jgi:hypothetical protein